LLLDAEADLEALAKSIEDGHVRLTGLQSEIDRLNREIMALGAVNLAALEELTTSRERKAFLDAQTADLTEAMTTLEDAIKKIDAETRDLLAGTFKIVNEHFGRMFPELFGGGSARLVMTGDEILDSGVQVMAQPPGQKKSDHSLAVWGPKGPHGHCLGVCHFSAQPSTFLFAGRGGRPLGRREHRALRQIGQEHGQRNPIFVHQSQQDCDGDGGAIDWRDHARAGRLPHCCR